MAERVHALAEPGTDVERANPRLELDQPLLLADLAAEVGRVVVELIERPVIVGRRAVMITKVGRHRPRARENQPAVGAVLD